MKPPRKFSAYATECIDAFKMKLKVFISQLKKRNLGIRKQQGECVENIVNFPQYIEKIKLLQEVFDCRCSDFSEEDRLLAFINPFSLNITF